MNENSPLFRKNLIASTGNLILQFLQALIVTACIQRVMGVEAYGYVSVIVNLVNAAGIVTVAFTAVSSRYIVVALQNQEHLKAQKIFSTISAAVHILALGSGLLFLTMAANLTKIMVVSPAFILQAVVLLIIVGIDFIVQLIQVPYLSVLYYEEKLYIYYRLLILANAAKVVATLAIYQFQNPVIWSGYFGGVCVHITAFLVYRRYTRHRYPFLKSERFLFDREILMEVLRSGVWVSVSKLAAILLALCGSYMSNIMIDPYHAGIYGSIVQLQSVLSMIVITVVNIYLPQIYRLYAAKHQRELIEYTKTALKTLGCIIGIMVGGLIVFGNEFMGLWITKEYLSYNGLIIISVCYLGGYTSELMNQVLITVGQTRAPAISGIISGICNVLLAIVFISCFSMGIYGIAFAQLIVSVLRSIIWFPIYTAKVLETGPFEFLSQQLKGGIATILTIAVGVLCGLFLVPDSWIKLVIVCGITGLISLVIICFVDRDIRAFVRQLITV